MSTSAVTIDTTTNQEPSKAIKFTHGMGGTAADGVFNVSVNGEWWTAVFEQMVDLKPGTYTVGEIQFMTKFWHITNARGDAAHFMVINDPGSGTNATELIAHDVLSDMPTTTTGLVDVTTSTISESFTVSDGDDIWIGFVFRKTDVTFTSPYTYTANGGPSNSAYFTITDAGTGAAPDIARTKLSSPIASRGPLFKKLELTRTDGYIAQETSSSFYSGSAIDLAVAEHNSDYQIKLEDVVVAAGNALTVAVSGYDAAGAETVHSTFILDMGATDRMTWDGTHVNLAGAGAEAGDTFDVCFNVRSTTIDVFWINKTTGQGSEGAADFTTISHTNKANSDRATAAPTVTAPRLLAFSGTATINKVYTGTGMMVTLGDSQAASNLLGDFLPDKFGRIWWDAGISGNKFASSTSSFHTAAHSRFCHTTEGLGDLCSFTGVLNVLSGMGINDISGPATTNTEAAAITMFNKLLPALGDFTSDATSTGADNDGFMILGLPKIPSGVAYADQGNYLTRIWNAMLESAAAGIYAVFYNPYDLSASNQTGYHAGGGDLDDIHYSTAGADAVADAIKEVYDNGSWELASGGTSVSLLIG